ncbi:MAG: MBL fold metallo-hydrolase [Patescibacteria group bacterium]
MKVKKIGHCCFVAEPKEGVRIMTDPGDFTKGAEREENITAILITHEHGDHLHIETLKKVLESSPKALVITNTAVGKLLDQAGITHQVVEKGQEKEISGVAICSFGNLHAEIYESMGRVQNTGYMIDSLCYPGDAFEDPGHPVEILALPVAGPWMRMKDALLYAQALKPRISFPVHDAFIQEWASFIWKWPGNVLPPLGIEFKKLELGKEEDL